MKNGIAFLAALFLIVFVAAPLLHGVCGGLLIFPLAALGPLLLVGGILFLVFAGLGLIGAVVIGVLAAVLLAVLVPFLIPLLIVILPFVLFVKLVRG